MTKPRCRHAPLAPQLLSNARALRQAQTDAERKLWWLLRNRDFAGFKFRRQYPIGGFIADFCSHEVRLIIELDGGQHADQGAADRARAESLERHGYSVLRFWNHQVLKEPDVVLELIFEALRRDR